VRYCVLGSPRRNLFTNPSWTVSAQCYVVPATAHASAVIAWDAALQYDLLFGRRLPSGTSNSRHE
jgi:hypothetical protein